MSAKRTYFALLGLIITLVLICGVATYFGYTMIKKEGDKLLDAKLNQSVASEKLKLLSQAKKDIAEYEELEQIAIRVVPQEKDQARTVLELISIANAADINIVNVTFPASELGAVKAKSSKGPATARNKQAVEPELTQLTAVEGLNGVYSMEIGVEADQQEPISFNQLIQYLEGLEKNRRTAQVSNISITPTEDDPNLVTFTLTLRSYVKP